MGVIICATRGGEGSLVAQQQAIARAKENDHDLVFVYVVDIHTIGEFDHHLDDAVGREMYWLGKVLLNIAKQRADKAGVKAKTDILTGVLEDKLVSCLEDYQADLLMLGAPRGTTAKLNGDDAVEQFVQRLKAKTGINIEIARPEAG